MKLKNILKINLLVLLLLTFTACEDFVGGDINKDPDNPASVPVTAQMPAIQIAMADMVGGDFSRFNCMLVQQVEGVARQWSSFNKYSGLQPNRFDAAWHNTYENILNELSIAKASTVEKGDSHYEGVVNILTAYTLMQATDVWDDMPYTEAFQGLGNTNPKYDTQADIYAEIFRLLDESITLFGGTSGTVVPGVEDVFYGGDIDSWVLAAHAIKARGFLHQGNYPSALTEAQAAFASRADNMAFNYEKGKPAPWYRFNQGREGDIEFHPTMRGFMTALNDTVRLGMMGQTFNAGKHPYMIEAQNQQLISFREIKFIEAEALQRTGGSAAQLRTAYLAGISASFTELGLETAEYDAYVAQASVDAGEGNITLDDIMMQKYFGLFLQPETYSDWRRTNIPALTPVSGSNIPVRWFYSTDEYLFNTNSPTEAETDIFNNRVGWNR